MVLGLLIAAILSDVLAFETNSYILSGAYHPLSKIKPVCLSAAIFPYVLSNHQDQALMTGLHKMSVIAMG
jgi:hypothetical protein